MIAPEVIPSNLPTPGTSGLTLSTPTRSPNRHTSWDTPDACISPTRERSFVCTLCESKFASQKALDMHSRIKHGTRSPVNARISGSVCPACCKDFHARVRCLNHLSDARRPRCRAWDIANMAPLTPDVVKKLNLKDRGIRRQAHKQGHTTVLSLRPPSVVYNSI